MNDQFEQPDGDTVAAIATAVGAAGIGVIRISGPDALAVAVRVFSGSRGGAVSSFPTHTAHHGSVRNPESGEEIDDAVLTIFRAPHSYTGEDVAEISCHGGTVTLRRVLNAVFQAGAAPAAPGEFTKRAFLNGRIDLAQAEAVNDLIRARTDEAQRLALRQLGGALSKQVSELITVLTGLLARIEAAIDFPEDVEEPGGDEIASQLRQMLAQLEQMLSSSDRGMVFREGIRLAIVGRPNVGKSSLLNALLRQTRAIVTPIPGTTRDIIEETININGIPVVAADTAGLRETSDEVEQIGVGLTESAMAAAEIVIVVVDALTGVTAEDRDIISRSGPTTVMALNKMDLVERDRVEAVLSEVAGTRAAAISAKTGEGIEALEDAIARLVLHGEVSGSESITVTNARHRQALLQARDAMTTAAAAADSGVPIDLISVDLVQARTSLGEITGETASEDLIDRIFSDFCIGK